MTMKYVFSHGKDHKAAAWNNHEVEPEKCVAAVVAVAVGLLPEL